MGGSLKSVGAITLFVEDLEGVLRAPGASFELTHGRRRRVALAWLLA